MTLPQPRNQAIDWVAVEDDYRRGSLSLRQLARKHDCSHSAIANFAARHDWPRRRHRDAATTDSGSASDGLWPADGVAVPMTERRC